MSIKVRLSNARAEYLTAALAYGRPIEPDSDAGWTPNDVLVLAGAALYSALRRGPKAYHGAVGSTFTADLHAAIELVADVLAQAVKGKYSDHTERRHASQGVDVAKPWPVSSPLLDSRQCAPPTPAPWP